jgi:hypothetical protein
VISPKLGISSDEQDVQQEIALPTAKTASINTQIYTAHSAAQHLHHTSTYFIVRSINISARRQNFLYHRCAAIAGGKY